LGFGQTETMRARHRLCPFSDPSFKKMLWTCDFTVSRAIFNVRPISKPGVDLTLHQFYRRQALPARHGRQTANFHQRHGAVLDPGRRLLRIVRRNGVADRIRPWFWPIRISYIPSPYFIVLN
jgi:hypothetical protein